jgi:hypothetical protein
VILAGSNGALVLVASQNRRKYHDESTNVSIVSVSRVAGPPHFGQVALRKPSWRRSGDSPDGRNSTSSGSRTGRSSSGTVWAPCSAQ